MENIDFEKWGKRLGLFVNGFISLAKIIYQLAPLWLPVVAGVLAYNMAIKAMMALGAIGQFIAMTREILIMQRAVGTAMTAQVLFNGSLETTALLIGSTVAILVGIGAAVYLIWKYWDDIVKAIGDAIQAFDQFLGLGTYEDQRKNAKAQMDAQRAKAPNESEAQHRYGMNVNTNVNVNAPKGYEVKSQTETKPITGNMGYAH